LLQEIKHNKIAKFCKTGCLTVCVTGAGAGADSAWKQKKLEARKMPENAAESPASSARFVGQCRILRSLV